MSNVIERYRRTSQMEFYRNALELQEDMMKFLLREKNVPRKYRGVVTYPIVAAFDELFDLMHQANRIYADAEESTAKRREIQTACIRKVDEIYRLLQRTVSLLWKDRLKSKTPSAEQQRLRNALNDFATRLKREEELLTGWRNSTKQNKKRAKE